MFIPTDRPAAACLIFYCLVGAALFLSVDGFTKPLATKFHFPSSRNACPQRLHDSSDANNEKNNNEEEKEYEIFWLVDRWEAADKLEIRLDATLVSCFTLARFLSYDMTLPPKDTPGFEIEDIVMLLDTFTSAVVLALFWTGAGLVTQIFEQDEDAWELPVLAQTTLLAAPPWLLLELLLGWPAAESTGVERIVLGTLGLMATLSLSRLVPKSLR